MRSGIPFVIGRTVPYEAVSKYIADNNLENVELIQSLDKFDTYFEENTCLSKILFRKII